MKIAFLLPIFKNTGPSNVVLSLIQQLVDDTNSLSEPLELTVVSFHPIDDEYQQKIAIKSPNVNVNYCTLSGFSFASIVQLRRWLKRHKIDCLHSHGLIPDVVAAFVARGILCNTVSTIHCDIKQDYQQEYSWFKAKIYTFLHYLALRFIDQKVAVSQGVAKALPIDAKVIYNGVNHCEYGVDNQPVAQHHDRLNLVFAGRLITRKNVLALVQYVNLLNQQVSYSLHLHIFGEGPLKREIESLNDGNITCYGFVDNFLEQVPENSIFVNPSVAEGMPMAVLEAIAHGMPVVLSEIKPHAEIAQHIHHGVALFNDQQSFQQALERLIDHQGQLAFEQQPMLVMFKQHFSNQIMAKRYLTLWYEQG